MSSRRSGHGRAVTVTDLVVDRGRRRVLHGLRCAVPPGQVTGLLGPSGSGKTTLMRAIVGVQQVASGAVTVLGEPAGSAGLRRRVGYVTQAPSVYADLTVRENARYFAALYGMGAREADAAIADVGLADAAGQLVRDLSGGQRGRASLACALVGEPELLVLDEPTVGPGPGAARRAVGPVPRPRRRRDDAARLQPRDGRGRPLRPAAAAPRGRAARRLHPGAAAHRRPAPTTWKRRSSR